MINKIPNKNNIIKPISKLKERFHFHYDIGLGPITDNPDVFKQKGGVTCHKLCVWVWFEDYWYLTKLNSISEFEEQIKKTYSKEQFYDYLISIVV